MSRLAIATSDGFAVNEHFGHAKFFRIYDIAADGYSFVDVRDAVAV